MKGLYTAGTLLGLAAMLGGSAFAAKPAAKRAAPKTTVKSAAKTTATTSKAAMKSKMAGHAKVTHDIGAVRAEKIALAKYHGKVVARPVLQKENGRRDYAIRLMSGKTEREVKVDATTGKIDSARIMTAAEHNRKTRKPMVKTASSTRKSAATVKGAATHKTAARKPAATKS